MNKYKHKIYVTICPECKKLINCYRIKKSFRKYPYCYCEEHSLWKPKIITEKDFVNISFLELYDIILDDADIILD